MTSTSALLDRHHAAVDALAAVSSDVTVYREMSENDLLEAGRLAAEGARIAVRHQALVAGELARRSTRELGYAGLAQRSGFRNAVEMVRVTAGVTAREASQAVRVGSLLQEAEPSFDLATGEVAVPTEPWLVPVSAALTSGSISVGHVDAIRAGLGVPTSTVTVEMLTAAASQLAREAATLDVDSTVKRAYRLRDEIDAQGVADREMRAFEKRSLRHRNFPDGTGETTIRHDIESNAKFNDLMNRATSPRFGGPRFVDSEQAALAERIVNDPRSTEQLLHDVFTHLLDAGADADASDLLGTGAPVLVVMATEKTVLERAGVGYLEGSNVAVSYDTLERIACAGAIQTIVFNAKYQPLNASPEDRLYNRAKRRALAARDGGCPVEGCTSPPSMTEAHHIEHVVRDDGKTTIENGLLLCRFHHLMLHNLHFEIGVIGGSLAMIPPPDHPGPRTPIRLLSKSRVLDELKRQAGYSLAR